MRKRSLHFVVFLTCAVLAGQARGESLDSMFQEANNAFWNGDYQKAVVLYEKLSELAAFNPDLSYNLGTAYARIGKLGKAVLNYERALRQDPGHVDARHNLAVIREHIARRASEAGRDADLAPAASPWRAILDRFSPRAAAIGFLIFHVLLFTTLIVRRFVLKEMPRLSLGVLAGVLGILTIATFSITIGKWHQGTQTVEAVVVHSGPLDIMEGPSSEVKRFTLEEGSRILVLEESGNWFHLRDGEGRDGWVEGSNLGKI